MFVTNVAFERGLYSDMKNNIRIEQKLVRGRHCTRLREISSADNSPRPVLVEIHDIVWQRVVKVCWIPHRSLNWVLTQMQKSPQCL
jgi:hypothetical protein